MKQKICKACGSVSYGQYPGSSAITFLLLLVFIIPGFIYSHWRGTKGRIVCPTCKRPDLIPIESAIGQEILSKRSTAKSVVSDRLEQQGTETQLTMITSPSTNTVVGKKSPLFIGIISIILGFTVFSMILANISKPEDHVPMGDELTARDLADYQRDPNGQLSELREQLAKKQYSYVLRKTQRLQSLQDPQINAIQNAAQDGAAKELNETRQIENEATEKLRKKTDEKQAYESKALIKCKQRIAKELHAKNWGEIPDSKNWEARSENEFMYTWSGETVRLQTIFGEIPVRGICSGKLNPIRIEGLVVGDKTVI